MRENARSQLCEKNNKNDVFFASGPHNNPLRTGEKRSEEPTCQMKKPTARISHMKKPTMHAVRCESLGSESEIPRYELGQQWSAGKQQDAAHHT